MATLYNSDVRPRLEDMPIRAPGVAIPCILEEGDITVYGGKTLSDGAIRRAESYYSFAAEIEKDDFVCLASDAAYTYDACEGMPVVKKTTSTSGIQGIVLDDPYKLVNRPANSAAADSVAERIAGKYFRVAMVWFPAWAYKGILANGQSTNISVGDILTYDVSSEVVVKAGSGSLTAAHPATADSLYVGVFFGLMTAGDSQE